LNFLPLPQVHGWLRPILPILTLSSLRKAASTYRANPVAFAAGQQISEGRWMDTAFEGVDYDTG
jgi:hypothetical protein